MKPTFRQASPIQFRKLVAECFGYRWRLSKTSIQIVQRAESCADPFAFIWRMIDLHSMQQTCSRRVDEENHLNFRVRKLRPNSSGQVQGEGISNLCI